MTVQLDLFGEVEAAEEDARTTADRRAEWAKNFRRQTVTIAYESSSGDKPGDLIEGWVCPACGGIEFGEYLLMINHGWAPAAPDAQLFGHPPFEYCAKTWRLESPQRPEDFDGIGVVRLTDGAA